MSDYYHFGERYMASSVNSIVRGRLIAALCNNLEAMARELERDPSSDHRVWSEHLALLVRLCREP
jgi:hypothetical protein